MSGGHWNHRNINLESKLSIERVTKILAAMEDIFYFADRGESGDSLKEEMAMEIYKEVVKLGDDIFDY